MDETQAQGVQAVAGHQREAVFDELPVFAECRPFQYPVAAVAFVVEQRVADGFHMHADLVRAAGFQPAFDQGHVTQPFQYAVMGHGMFPHRAVRRIDGHSHPVGRVAGDIAGDGPFVFVEVAPHQRMVDAPDGVVVELPGEKGVRPLVFGHDQQPGGVFVDPVYQSGPHVARLEQGQALQVVGQGIDQGAGVVAVAGMYDHAGLFIDDDEVGVFVNDVQRNVFGDDLQFARRIGQHDGDLVEGLDFVARFGGFAVDEDVAGVGSGLDTVARGVFEAGGQEFVEPQHALASVGGYMEVLE